MKVEINVDWSELGEGARKALSRAVRICAMEAKAEAQANIRGPVAAHQRRRKSGGKWIVETVTDLIDTGAMINSVYVATESSSERAQAVQAANSEQPGVEFGIPNPAPQGDLQAQTAVAVGYGAAVEALYPYLTPAGEKVRAKANEIAEAELKKEGF